MEKGTKSPKFVGSVFKAVDVLEEIAKSEDGLGVTEISQRLNYGVSATYHLLNTLKQCNMIEQDKKTKKYRIGFTLFRISGMAKQQNLLGGLSSKFLDKLQKEVHETANLSALEGDEVICIAQSESSRLLKMFTQVGARTPFHYTAGGKILMAYKPKRTREEAIKRVQFIRYTPNTIMDAELLLQEIERSKERGYGLDNEEREEGVICIAAPVFDCYGDAACAISISGPSYRLESNIPALAEKAREIAWEFSASLGYRPDGACGSQESAYGRAE